MQMVPADLPSMHSTDDTVSDLENLTKQMCVPFFHLRRQRHLFLGPRTYAGSSATPAIRMMQL